MTHRVLVPVTNPLGGIRTHMLYSFKRLHEAGFRFTFLSAAGAAFDSFKQDVLSWEDTEFIEAPKGGGGKGLLRTVRRALAEKRFALIHSQGLHAGTIASASNFPFLHRKQVPHIITLHDVILPENDIPGRFKGVKRALIACVTRRASVIVPVSKDCEANHLEIFPAWKRGPVRIETIQNGIDVDRLIRSRDASESGAPLRREFGIPDGAVLAGFFGRFMPQKGFDILLEALTVLVARGYGDRFRLMATKDPNGYLNETIAAATEQPEIARMIHFIDAVPDIAPLLLQCDFCVIPSRWEACPILPMEALVLGVPVVGSNCIGLREVLRDTPSLVFERENAESLAETLIRFIEHSTTPAAKEFAPEAKRRFDVRVASARLLELYRRLI